MANLTYLMVIKAPEYQSMPSNNHTIAKEARMERGTISTADGTVLATSVRQEDGSYKREYPAGELAAHIVGYTSERFGTAGIEAAYNDTLRGEQNFASFTDVVNSLAGIQTKGNDVVLSIDSRIQQAAQDALAGQVGAVVALNPETGAVYALASSPTFDAANYEELLTAAADGGSDSSELFNRATQALYAPGSTFKMVTLAAALQDHIATADTTYDSPGEMDIGNAPVTNVKKRSYGKITLEQATVVLVEHRVRPGGRAARQRFARADGVQLRVQRRHPLRFAPGHVPHARPRGNDHLGNRLGRLRRARGRAREPRRAPGHRAADGAGGRRHRQRGQPSCSPTWSTASTTPTASAASRPFP